MDVRLISNMPYSVPRSVEQADSAVDTSAPAKKVEVPSMFQNDDSISEKVREQVVMNLEQVQNFLYMLIGSKIKVQSNHESIGSSVNTAA